MCVPGQPLRRTAEAGRASFGKSFLRFPRGVSSERGRCGVILCQQLPMHACPGRMHGRRPGWAPVGLSACEEASRSWARGQAALRRGERRPAGAGVWRMQAYLQRGCRCEQSAGAGLQGPWLTLLHRFILSLLCLLPKVWPHPRFLPAFSQAKDYLGTCGLPTRQLIRFHTGRTAEQLSTSPPPLMEPEFSG